MKNINYKLIVPYVLIIVLVVVGVYYFNRANKLELNLQSETNLRLAMIDTISTYRNQRNELVSEKRTMQFKLNEKEFENKELVKRIKETEKKNATLEKKVTVFAAALIESQIVIDSLQKSKVYVSEKDSSVLFTSEPTSNLQYIFKVKPVYTFKNQPPQLTFVEFKIPNKQYIEFHWNNTPKEGFPVSFSVTNTNPYFKTVNIESYAIPEIYKPNIKPSFWNKVTNGLKSGGKSLIYVGIGAGVVLLLK